MGLGTGVKCDRCGEQISYDMSDYELKSDGRERNLCEDCLRDFKKAEYDKTH